MAIIIDNAQQRRLYVTARRAVSSGVQCNPLMWRLHSGLISASGRNVTNRGLVVRFIATLLLGFALFVGEAAAQQAGTGWLGAPSDDLTQEEAEALGWDAPRGSKITALVPDGPAAKTGLLVGDIIISMDGVEIESVQGLVDALGRKTAGTEVLLRLRRGGREVRMKVALGARPAELAQVKPVRSVKTIEAENSTEDGPLPMLDTSGHMATVSDLAFTPDGTQIVSASKDKTIRVWDLATGKTVRILRGNSALGDWGKIEALTLSRDGKVLAVGGLLAKYTGNNLEEVSVVRLYDFASGRMVALLKGHRDGINALSFSLDGRLLISGSNDAKAMIWDIGAFSRDGGLFPQTEVPILKPRHVLSGHSRQIYAVAFTPDGTRAVTGSFDHDLRLWRVADGAEIAHLPGHGERVHGVAVAPDGTIVSGDENGEIRLWRSDSAPGTDGNAGAFLKILARQDTAVDSLALSPDGRYLLTGSGKGEGKDCHVFELATGKEIVAYPHHNSSVHATAISQDGRWAATAGDEGYEIHIWDLTSGQRRGGQNNQPLTLGGTGRTVWSVGFSADGKEIGWGNLWDPTSPVDRGPLQHALSLPLNTDVLPAPRALAAEETDRFRRAVTNQGEWLLERRKGGYDLYALLDISAMGSW